MSSILQFSSSIPLWWVWVFSLFLTACGLINSPLGTAPPPPPATLLPAFSPPLTPLATQTSSPEMPTVGRLPDPAGYGWQVAGEGLNKPVGLANAGDGSGRLFVLEQRGVIRILRHGQVLDTTFLDLRDRIEIQSNEQGLLGIAFHPRYSENGYFYLNYTDVAGNTVVARYQVSADPGRADPATETRLLQVRQPYGNHNGGGLAFGPDGFLYIGLGDGGAANDPHGNGQNREVLLGKLLRIDVDSAASYAIPPDNPFANNGGRSEVWAYGLRNPWRFAFDPLTGDLYIGDVGQNKWEEIDFQAAGSQGGVNFGWDYREGAHEFAGSPPDTSLLTDPVAEYGHDLGCSVTGGVVYRGSNLPEWYGLYLYGDYCSGNIWGLLHTPSGGWENRLLFTLEANITSFGLDEAGEVFLADHNGKIFQLVAQAP